MAFNTIFFFLIPTGPCGPLTWMIDWPGGFPEPPGMWEPCGVLLRSLIEDALENHCAQFGGYKQHDWIAFGVFKQIVQ